MGRSERYDFEIQGEPGGNVGLIMSHIENGSYILECGCATGYMTKYMTEKKNCHVHIIEIDPECCEKASKFAEDSFTGDLTKDGWVSYYKNAQYDYILFADVLEHLTNPVEVLKKATDFLGKTGKIIISIPNVCHNDVIIRMFYDHWNYTGLGLLDETHVHFWGVNELEAFAKEAGLKVDSYECVVMPTQHTEQRIPGKIDEDLMKALKKRQFGEVYQWVVVCSKE